jgi:TrmH family RNA methyltransferase
MITSVDNPKVKQARSLLERRGREQQGRCLAEGVRLVEDAMRAGIHPALVFYVAEIGQNPRGQAILTAAEAADPAGVVEVTPAVLATLSDTVTSQGLIAVLPIPGWDTRPVGDLALVLDQVRDPGNLGVILRSAEAAGVTGVLLAHGCTDPWSPKVVRAGMGAHFRLPVWMGLDWPQIAARLGTRPVWAADAAGAVDYDRVDWTGPSALIVGGETEGLSDQAAALCTGRIAIPMLGHPDSLNAAMAATILLFEAARQRRHVHAV